MVAIFARNFAFLAGAILAVLVLLTVYDEDVITVEHVLTIMTVLGAVVAGKLVFKSKFFLYSFTFNHFSMNSFTFIVYKMNLILMFIHDFKN